MNIVYQDLRQITDAEFVDLLKRSTLAERRPIDDPKSIRAMLIHSNLLCTAWGDSKLIGVARSITDFEYCCYLSDLAVDKPYQRIGIGKRVDSFDAIKARRKGKNHFVGSAKRGKLLPANWLRSPQIGLDSGGAGTITMNNKSLPSLDASSHQRNRVQPATVMERD